MSRYIDLDGLTWDGTPITSKIQEVKTKSGYMQGITTGWLWGDNVPHIDLADHDKQIRDEVIEEFADSLTCQACFTNMQKDAIRIYAEQMKEEQNE